MLVIISDLHLGDGTCGRTISADAFRLFVDRLQELAYNASWRRTGQYRPIEEIDILLLGDILDPLHSELWLETPEGETPVRPWTDTKNPRYAEKLGEITRAILKKNEGGLSYFRKLVRDERMSLPPATSRGTPDFESKERIPVQTRIHYMVGNHDWYYYIPGKAFDAVREEIIEALALSNPPSPFPFFQEEGYIQDILGPYRVYARHGDYYDSFNYNAKAGRAASTLGDIFAVEMLNRFPLEVERQLGDELPPNVLDGLRELVNVRPVLAMPLWISGQIRYSGLSEEMQTRIKKIWDTLGNEFLGLNVVRRADEWLRFDPVDALSAILKISSRTSFNTVNSVVLWVQEKFRNGENLSFADHALKEKAFLDGEADFIVYGHTHHQEVVALDTTTRPTREPAHAPIYSQIYFNSGTWHTYYDLAIHKPQEQKFIPYQVMTYLTFYKEGERSNYRFETWSGTFS
jgi:UDP-2,3-diacylglucosamine pyrophosphatase LpxH